MKEDYDGAEPAASSYALSNLLRLAALAAPDEAQVGLSRHLLPSEVLLLPIALVRVVSCTLILMTLRGWVQCSTPGMKEHSPFLQRLSLRLCYARPMLLSTAQPVSIPGAEVPSQDSGLHRRS